MQKSYRGQGAVSPRCLPSSDAQTLRCVCRERIGQPRTGTGCSRRQMAAGGRARGRLAFRVSPPVCGLWDFLFSSKAEPLVTPGWAGGRAPGRRRCACATEPPAPHSATQRARRPLCRAVCPQDAGKLLHLTNVGFRGTGQIFLCNKLKKKSKNKPRSKPGRLKSLRFSSNASNSQEQQGRAKPRPTAGER